MGAGRGTPLVYRGSLVQAISELSAPILKSLGILERGDPKVLCDIFFSGSESIPPQDGCCISEGRDPTPKKKYITQKYGWSSFQNAQTF